MESFLEDIEHSCTKIVDYTRGLSRDETFADSMRLDAILMNLHVYFAIDLDIL